MRLQTIASALVLSGAVFSLSDSSPWMLLSTSKFQDAASHNQMQTSSEALTSTRAILSACPTDRYLVIIQPGVHTADLGRETDCSMTRLCRAAKDPRIKSWYTVSEVVGDVAGADMSSYIKSACAKKNRAVTVDEVALTSPASGDKTLTLAGNDAILADNLEEATKSDSFTILFYSTPPEPAYEPEFFETSHMDLKRDVQGTPYARDENSTHRDTRPLFEKYQFFSPGIFMGLVVTLVLLSILSVGIRALASLEVSYGAFEKEMGPAAQKKQQ